MAQTEKKQEEFPKMIQCKYRTNEAGIGFGHPRLNCGQMIFPVESDFQKFDWYLNQQNFGINYGLMCPHCGALVLVDSNELSDRVKISASMMVLNTES